MWGRLGLRIFWRGFFLLIIFGIGAGTTFFLREEIILWLLIPADGKLSPFEDGLPVFSKPTGALTATFGVAARGGLILAYPFGVYFAYSLLRPVLTTRYRRVFYVFIPASTALVVGGVAFAYYVVMPVMLRFLLSFSEGIAVPLIAVDEYLGLLFSMALWFGVIFQIPLVMLLLARLNIIGYRQLRKRRRLVGTFAVILSIILTPTFDGFSMLLMAVPIYVLYEVGLFLSWTARPEDGNYMFIKSIWHGIDWYLRKVEAVIKSPYTVPRWAFRKVFRR